MKNPKLLLFIAICILLASCNTDHGKKAENQNKTSAKDIPSKSIAEKHTQTETDEDNGCVRGEPEPVINKKIFPSAKFRINGDKTEGFETVTLNNGDILNIKNSGCENYVLRITFETSRFNIEVTNTPFWFEKASELLNEIKSGIDSPLDIDNAITALKTYTEEHKTDLTYNNNEIVFSNEKEEIPSYITIVSAEVLPDNKTALTIMLWMGPL